MNISEEQLNKLKKYFDGVRTFQEGGFGYVYIPNLPLGEGTNAVKIDVLLCPFERDGYPSRLFLSEKISGNHKGNWNGNIRILDRNWYAVSWKVKRGLELFDMLATHLNAFTNE